jgi:zinc protease
MKQFLLAALAALALPHAALAQDAAPPASAPVLTAADAWGYAGSDIPVDPAVRFGVLPNGMKYALLRNTTPADQVAVRFHINVGSLAEENDQRGLAHFLEHMAFNGSANVPEGEMVRLLEREGLAFGADTNASTGFEDTSYRLDLPRNTPQLIDLSLMLMREIASNLSIAPDAVDRERGVILAERQARDNYGLRSSMDQLAFVSAGMLLNDRWPIGSEDVIRTAPAQRIRDFYARWYRPERATLVIVGAIDVDAVEAAIRARFADWQGRGPSPGDPDPGLPDFARPAASDTFTHPAIAENVSVTRLRPWHRPPDTRAERQRQVREAMALAIIERRLSRIALQPEAPFLSAGVSESGEYNRVRQFSFGANARDGEWQRALTAVENEVRRAIEHGFSDAEVAEQAANLRRAVENGVVGANTRRTATLAAQLLARADRSAVFNTPDVTRAIALSVLDGPDAANGARVTAALRAMVAGYGAPLVRVVSKRDIDDGERAILAALTTAQQITVSPPQAAPNVQFAYTDFGQPGRVVSDDRIADLGIRRIRFANNVMLNIRRTDFEASRARVLVRIDGGSLLIPREDPTRLALVPLMTLGGLEAHSIDELRTILAGRSVAPSFGMGTDSFSMGASVVREALPLQMQLFAATLSHPGYRPEAISLFRRSLPQQYAAADATPAAVIGREVAPIIADNDPRLIVPPLEVMMGLDWTATRAALADPLSRGAIEIGVVGDVREDDVIATVARTFGALPDRRATFEPRPDARIRRFASDLSRRTLLHRGERDQAVVLTYWPARDDSDLRETLVLDVLAAVMQLRLNDELRERLGRSYSPSASADLSSDFPGFGTIFAGGQVAFSDLAATETAISDMAAALQASPVSADELTRARAPIIERLEAARRENGYWLGYVARAGSDPARLNRSRQALDLIRSVTVADVQAAARCYLREDRMLRIRVISRDAAGDDPAISPSDDVAASATAHRGHLR